MVAFIINVLWLFLAVPWVDLQCAVVVLTDHTHLLFEERFYWCIIHVCHDTVSVLCL